MSQTLYWFNRLKSATSIIAPTLREYRHACVRSKLETCCKSRRGEDKGASQIDFSQPGERRMTNLAE